MTATIIAEVAAEVDRLVIHIHRTTVHDHGPRLRELIEPLGLSDPGQLFDLAEFVAADACTEDIVSRRFCYVLATAASASGTPVLLAELQGAGLLVDGRSTPELAAAVNGVLDIRAEVAASAWPDVAHVTRRRGHWPQRLGRW